MKPINVSHLAIHPIKSSQAITLDKTRVELAGFAFDRRFVVIDKNNKAITGRTHPQLTQMQITLNEQAMVVNAPGMAVLNIKTNDFSAEYLETRVWSSVSQGQHCGERYDNWFSRFLGLDCRLVYFGPHTSRQIKDFDQPVGFADGYPVLLISEASLADLNQRSVHHHQMEQFRPNLVVNNTVAFAEDSWQRIRVGEVEFIVHSPCSRCNFPKLNLQTGQPHPDGEPLSVLRHYRTGQDKKIYFGQNIIPLNEGEIKLGDKVEIIR
ncbi:MAG: hypothetical protein ACJAUL_001852 [Paraglaciecola sp.]|jgi:uncharacterized protein YcbX